MPRENKADKKKRALNILKVLKRQYPDAECALTFSNAFELLVATILSAQCTDKRVNMVTPDLFRRYKKPKDYAQAKQKDVEDIIRSTGFYQNKAKNIIGAAQGVTDNHGGKVPKRLEDLVQLPGVGRKTANVILGNAFGIPGLTVDTHMIRINNLLKLTSNKNPVKIEFDLMELIPEKDWTMYSHYIIHHGRAKCIARRPQCHLCEIAEFCPSAKKL